MVKIKILFYNICAYTYFTLYTPIGAILLIVGSLFNPYCSFNNAVIRYWAKGILFFSGVRINSNGSENIGNDSYIFMANHLSSYDILIALALLPGTIRFIAKKEVFRIPLFGSGIRASGTMKIDRGNSVEARKILTEAIDKIKSGVSVIIFPEGTRSLSGEIGNFKKGGFILALQSKVPILPFVIKDTQNILKKNSFIINPGVVTIEFLKPINTEKYDFETRNQLIEQVRAVIVERFQVINNEN